MFAGAESKLSRRGEGRFLENFRPVYELHVLYIALFVDQHFDRDLAFKAFSPGFGGIFRHDNAIGMGLVVDLEIVDGFVQIVRTRHAGQSG